VVQLGPFWTNCRGQISPGGATGTSSNRPLILDEGQRSNNGHRPLKELGQVTYLTLRLLLMCESLIN